MPLGKNRPGVLLYRRGRTLVRHGNERPGWGQVSRALAEDSSLAAAWILNGDLLCKKGDLPNARYCYRLAFHLQGLVKEAANNDF
jgi:Flp pilus assembly protein TadD